MLRDDEREELTELKNLFDMQWKADQRAIKIWQEKTGRHDTWPDRCDMVVSMLEDRDKLVKKIETICEQLEDLIDKYEKV